MSTSALSAGLSPEGGERSRAAASPLHFGLTPDLRAFRQDVRRFAVEQVRPRAARLEWQADAADRIDWELVAEASARGWRTMSLPVEDGGQGASALALCLLIEELAYGDMGFAVLLDQTLKVQRVINRLAPSPVRERLLSRLVDDPRMVLAICFTEPLTGSNYIMGTTDFCFST